MYSIYCDIGYFFAGNIIHTPTHSVACMFYLHIDLYHVIKVNKKPQHFTVRQKITYFEISKIIGNGENLHSNCVFDIIVNNQILHTTFVHINTCKSSLIIQHMITKKRNLKK